MPIYTTDSKHGCKRPMSHLQLEHIVMVFGLEGHAVMDAVRLRVDSVGFLTLTWTRALDSCILKLGQTARSFADFRSFSPLRDYES